MHKNLLSLSSCLLILLCGSFINTQARQLSSATLRGVVTDPQDAVVAGATVRATHVATGTTRETLTNGEGEYVFPGLPVGEYKVSASAKGFAQTVSSTVTMLVGQNASVNFTLNASGPTEEI